MPAILVASKMKSGLPKPVHSAAPILHVPAARAIPQPCYLKFGSRVEVTKPSYSSQIPLKSPSGQESAGDGPPPRKGSSVESAFDTQVRKRPMLGRCRRGFVPIACVPWGSVTPRVRCSAFPIAAPLAVGRLRGCVSAAGCCWDVPSMRDSGQVEVLLLESLLCVPLVVAAGCCEHVPEPLLKAISARHGREAVLCARCVLFALRLGETASRGWAVQVGLPALPLYVHDIMDAALYQQAVFRRPVHMAVRPIVFRHTLLAAQGEKHTFLSPFRYQHSNASSMSQAARLQSVRSHATA